jgi:hypothetical protein
VVVGVVVIEAAVVVVALAVEVAVAGVALVVGVAEAAVAALETVFQKARLIVLLVGAGFFGIVARNAFAEVGYFTHACEEQLVCKATCEKVPYFNAPIYLENKEQVGQVDEILGAIRDHVCFDAKSMREEYVFSVFPSN